MSALSARRPIHGIAVDMGSGLGEALRVAKANEILRFGSGRKIGRDELHNFDSCLNIFFFPLLKAVLQDLLSPVVHIYFGIQPSLRF